MGSGGKRRHIILIGFSGSGKSSIGRKLAERLARPFVDTDEEVARKAGQPIPEIFAAKGEAAFRQMEREAVERACGGETAVISVGGGALESLANREVMGRNGWLVCLEAKPETGLRRLREGLARGEVVRPLLSGPNPLARITSLKDSRQGRYALADWTIHTDRLSQEEVVDEIARAYHLLRRLDGETSESGTGPDAPTDEEPGILVSTSAGNYKVVVRESGLSELGAHLRRLFPEGRNVRVISDANVYPLYGERVEQSVREESFPVASRVVPPGEAAKSLREAELLYDWLLEQRTERRDVIVALGGGTTGDLAGFVAATYLRGVPYVQVPTTLLAMVDSAIGGKTGVNHRRGKNLVGAFYQPRLVLADVATLRTLPSRELSAGWGEVIKYGVIEGTCLGDSGGRLFATLEDEAGAIGRLSGPLAEVIGTCGALKAAVVSQDEREAGLRMVLNYGHTVGHALEAVTDYDTFLHGEAVAIGMHAAARLSEELGRLPAEAVVRQKSLLERFGLPTTYSGASVDSLLEAMRLDKKSRGKRIQWVLPSSLGRVDLGIDVPDSLVRQVLGEITSQ